MSDTTGVTVRTIERIVSEGNSSASKKNEISVFKLAGKHRPKNSSLTTDLPE